MGYIPTSINTTAFGTLLDSYKSCLDTKGTVYHNRLVGGMKHSNSDLLKLELIISLLNNSSNIGLDCIFDEAVFPGMIQSTFSATAPSPTGHLQSFVDFASRFCKDCITSTLVPAPAAAATTYRLLAEDGVTEITLENGGDINLQ
jgi:hypothetical protein